MRIGLESPVNASLRCSLMIRLPLLRIGRPVLIYGMYCVAMVLYPFILQAKSFSNVQRTTVVSFAMLATTASPVWVEHLSQRDFNLANIMALFIGTMFAYFTERLKRENELMHAKAIAAAKQTAAADSRLNHVLKNKIIVIDSRLEQARSLMMGGSSQPSEAPVEAEALLLEAQKTMQSCVEWIHRREMFIQLASGQYHSTLQLASVHSVLRRLLFGTSVVLRVECPAEVWFDVDSVTARVVWRLDLADSH